MRAGCDMSKKPDHTTSALSLSESTIDEAVIQKVKKRLSIDPDFDLRGRVEGARQSYFLALHFKQKTLSLNEQRILFKGVRAKTKKLRDCISGLVFSEQARLGMDLLDRLEYDLLLLESRAERDLSGGKDKRDKPLQLFILDMHAVYREATGHDDRYTRDPGTGEITGPFFEFLKAFLPAMGVERKDATLADDIYQILPPKNTF